MSIELDAPVAECGDDVSGTATWSAGPATVSLRWATSGHGTVDTEVAATVSLSGGSASFDLAVPAGGPMSFEGTLTGVHWEVVLDADGATERAPVTILPAGGLALWVRQAAPPPG